jgi:hypothetical protein
MGYDEDWTAAVADRIIRESRLAADRLRAQEVQPIGLVPRSHAPMPGHLAWDTYGPAADLRAGGTVTVVCLRYGDAADQSAAVIDVTSDFTAGFESRRPLEYELGRAQNEYEALARGERETSDPVDEPECPVTQRSGEILLDGIPQTVAIRGYGDYQAFRFEADGVHVTVVGRHVTPGQLRFEPIADLTPYLPSTPDREELRSHLREMRREASG